MRLYSLMTLWAALFIFGVGAEARDDVGLYRAIEMDNAARVSAYLQGGDYDANSKISTPGGGMAPAPLLIWAARDASLKVIQLLLAKGADVNAANDVVETPLMLASFFPDVLGQPESGYSRHEQAVQLLLGARAALDPTPGVYTALAYAAYAQHYRIAEKLLAAGADPDGGAINGQNAVNTPLMMAVLSGDVPIATLLLRADADPRVRNGQGKAAMDLAVKYQRKKISQMIQCALDLAPGEKFSQRCE